MGGVLIVNSLVGNEPRVAVRPLPLRCRALIVGQPLTALLGRPGTAQVAGSERCSQRRGARSAREAVNVLRQLRHQADAELGCGCRARGKGQSRAVVRRV